MNPTRRTILSALASLPFWGMAGRVPEAEEALEPLSGAARARLLDGEWVSDPGAIYSNEYDCLYVDEVLYEGACNTGKSGMHAFSEFIEATDVEECESVADMLDRLQARGYLADYLQGPTQP